MFSWQVYLREVAGDNDLGIPSHAGEEHADLRRGGVLCLVENDDGIAECTAAHEGERCYLDDALLHQVLQADGGDHILEGIIEGLEIGIYLVFHVAGQEAQLLAGLHSGTREDDAAR